MGLHLFIENLWTNPLWFFCVVVTVIVSICVHELAHGVAAIRCGDKTPIHTGHMTLNPLVHMGPYAILALLVMGFSWGAMPIDPTRMRGRYAEAFVAFAGPLSNILMAGVVVLSLGVWYGTTHEPPERSTSKLLLPSSDSDVTAFDVFQWVKPAQDSDELGEKPWVRNFRFFLLIFASTNIMLFLFNLIPVPPLDGSHIVANFHRGYARFVWDPHHEAMLTMVFVFAVMVGSRVFAKCVPWTLEAVAFVAGI